MNRKLTLGICAALMVAGVSLIATNSASAGWGPNPVYPRCNPPRCDYQNPGFGYRNDFSRGFGQAGFYGNYGFNRNPATFDLYRGSAGRYRNQWDYIPDRHDLHRGPFNRY